MLPCYFNLLSRGYAPIQAIVICLIAILRNYGIVFPMPTVYPLNPPATNSIPVPMPQPYPLSPISIPASQIPTYPMSYPMIPSIPTNIPPSYPLTPITPPQGIAVGEYNPSIPAGSIPYPGPLVAQPVVADESLSCINQILEFYTPVSPEEAMAINSFCEEFYDTPAVLQCLVEWLASGKTFSEAVSLCGGVEVSFEGDMVSYPA